ncbi:hypothetical protein PENANT_c007G01283 [Penicillium antarcticum]|uniref:Uncharacterized protein n=1 Tax=Penicillium antarcticum TaxID=416450 RepID=A0A1V6QCT5_9EURO|nr:uncharacterized protein N7508_003354 [Penicillium antarcticum]KAJ5312524.1 hypothetical protein N7508_003354 [Penicillium antarcticum]OQD86807.1 hypothetical protein PENANT_c007G01283 [Penicillium antarcticum]
MLFSSITNIGFIVALAASSALGAVNTRQTVDDLSKVHISINKAKDAMDRWNGGLMGAIPVAHSIYNAQKTAEGARANLGNTDPFEGDDKHQVMRAYKGLQPDFISAIRAAEEKAPAFKKAGVAYVARGMLGSLRMEKDDFETAMKRTMTEEHYREVVPFVNEVDAAFVDADKAFAS